MKLFTLILLLTSLLTACSLERKNPLDPLSNSGITVPQTVSNMILSSSNGKVNIQWTRLNNVYKYYIYRSLSYNGQYVKISEIMNPLTGENMTYIDDDVVINSVYFYKLSSVNIQGLEGHISNWKSVKVK